MDSFQSNLKFTANKIEIDNQIKYEYNPKNQTRSSQSNWYAFHIEKLRKSYQIDPEKIKNSFIGPLSLN